MFINSTVGRVGGLLLLLGLHDWDCFLALEFTTSDYDSVLSQNTSVTVTYTYSM